MKVTLPRFLAAAALLGAATAYDTLLTTVHPTTHAGSIYWREHCTNIPANAPYIKLIMGTGNVTVTDYFKPAVKYKRGCRASYYTWCEMLLSDVNHLWSGTGEIGSWVKPSYSDAHSPFLGGSGAQWPNENVGPTKICVGDNDPPGRVACYTTPNDDRLFLSYWGSHPGASYTGGCCSNSKTRA
eukprot:gene10646-2844_t